MTTPTGTPPPTFYRGARADLNPGGLIAPGCSSDYGKRKQRSRVGTFRDPSSFLQSAQPSGAGFAFGRMDMIDPGDRRSVGIATAGLLLFMAAACTSSTLSTAPANMPPPIPDAELTGLPGVPYSSVIESAGTPVVRSGPARRGEPLVTIPYRYRHTAVLTQDVTGFSITVRGVQAPAGSPGYYAGTFTASYGARNAAPLDMWCFLPRAAGGSREALCLFRNLPGLAAIAPTRSNPYLWYQFSPMTGTFNYVRTPIFERRRIDLPVELALEYRFDGWRGEDAQIALYAVGRHVVDLPIPRDSSGRLRLPTIAGSYAVSKDPADPTAARIAAAD